MPFYRVGALAALLAAMSMLASCSSGSQTQSGGLIALPSAKKTSSTSRHGRSWMLHQATSEVLVYATGGCGGTCVLSYTSGNVVGSLTTYGRAVCSDNSGNVFITNNDEVVEYSHGGTEPIATLGLPGMDASGCSVDPTTGNLAVVFIGTNDDVAVFPKAEGTPTLYSSKLESEYCGYDDLGNLFVSGYNAGQPGLSELPWGSSAFEVLSIDGSLINPGQVQWDGTYMAYEGFEKGQVNIFRLSVSGSTASIVQTVKLNGIRGWAWQSWIYGGRILVPYSNHGNGARNASQWKYPKGGPKSKTFTLALIKHTCIWKVLP